MESTGFDTLNTLGTVEGKIRSIVRNLGEDADYQFCNWAQANIALDSVTKPTIVYVLPPSGNFDFRRTQVRDRPETQLAFVCNTDFDFDSTENDGIIEAMKRLAVRFIKAFNQSGLFEQIDGYVPYQVLYDHLDQNVTGVVLNLTLVEEDGISLCNDGTRE